MRTGWTIAALLLALALCLAGCAPGGGRVLDVSGERKALGEAVDGLFAALDARDGEHMVYSRIGLKYPCVYFDEMQEMTAMELQQNACIIVDEAQFLTKEEVMYLVDLVDRLDIPVLCYGLRADFKGDLFPGSYQLLVMADKIEEVKTICWCGKKATFNARFDENGKVLKEGEQVVLGANDKYIGLCRRHWMEGNLGPDFHVEAP